MSCTRAQEFLAQHNVNLAEIADAGKQKLGRDAALKLAGSAARVIVMKGKRVVEIDMSKGAPADDELAAVLLGPTGNLRAPTIRRGQVLLVGFNTDAYRKAFGLE